MSACSGDDCTHSSHKADPSSIQKSNLEHVPLAAAPAVLMVMMGIAPDNIAKVLGLPKERAREPQPEEDKQRNLARAEAKRERKRMRLKQLADGYRPK